MTRLSKVLISCAIIVAVITIGFVSILQRIPKQPGDLVSDKGSIIKSSMAMNSSADEMMDSSDLVIVGNIVDTPYEKGYDLDVYSGTRTEVGLHLPIQIETIIKGNFDGDTITPSIHIGDIINGESFKLQGMKPVNVGDKMVFFIAKTEFKGQPFYSILNRYQGFYKLEADGEVMTDLTSVQDSGSIKIIADEYSPFMNGITLKKLEKIESSPK